MLSQPLLIVAYGSAGGEVGFPQNGHMTTLLGTFFPHATQAFLPRLLNAKTNATQAPTAATATISIQIQELIPPDAPDSEPGSEKSFETSAPDTVMDAEPDWYPDAETEAVYVPSGTVNE